MTVPSRSRKWKWWLMLAACLMAATVLGATLRSRPDVKSMDGRLGLFSDPTVQSTISRINAATAQTIAASGLQTADSADTLAVCRRLSLALVGSALSLEEIRAIEQINVDDRVAWWCEHLLADKRWADYFSQRFARTFVGTHEGPFLLFRRRKFNTWLSDQLEKGQPYDAIVRQMLSSEGLWTDTPAVNFVTATMEEGDRRRADPIRLAGRTSRAFLAMRIDCLQCHDDVLDRTNFGTVAEPRTGVQQDFHGLAAFFAGTTTADPVFRGIIEDKRPYKFQFLHQPDLEDVPPNVPFYQSLLPAGDKPRERLAQWVTHRDNKMFARATVNRVWALMFGKALVEPVDDIPLVGPHPAQLDILAEDFVEHGYNLRRLVALIAGSAAFNRASRADFEITPAHEQVWAVFPLVQLRPDQVATSIIQSCRLTAIDRDSSIFLQLQAYGDGQEFVSDFGDRGEDEFHSDPITITQRLLMMNGNMVSERTKVDLVTSATTRIATFVRDDQQAIDELTLTMLNRYPTHSEAEAFQQHLDGKRGNQRSRALADIAWAMLNTTEFSWNH